MTSDPARVSAGLIELYRARGGDRYDEVVTMIDHGLQCGSLALDAGADPSTVTAAFLHDIGHLLTHVDDGTAPTFDRRHEVVGARYLAQWFNDAVVEPIRLHVDAKRFLCAVEPDYAAGLSAGSVRSLELQGGPMTDEEVDAFDALPHSAEAVRIRRWDDHAKIPGAPTPSLADFETIACDLLRCQTPEAG